MGFSGCGTRQKGGQGEATVTRSRKDCLIVFYDLILLQPIFHSDFDDLVILWNKCWEKKKTTGMGGEAIFFTGRGGAGRGKAKNLRDGAGRGTPPSPQCGAGRGRGQNLRGGEGPGRGTYCVYQLIEIICCSKGNLNLHCIM